MIIFFAFALFRHRVEDEILTFSFAYIYFSNTNESVACVVITAGYVIRCAGVEDARHGSGMAFACNCLKQCA